MFNELPQGTLIYPWGKTGLLEIFRLISQGRGEGCEVGELLELVKGILNRLWLNEFLVGVGDALAVAHIPLGDVGTDGVGDSGNHILAESDAVEDAEDGGTGGENLRVGVSDSHKANHFFGYIYLYRKTRAIFHSAGHFFFTFFRSVA